MVDRIAVEWRSAGLDEATLALAEFAVKLTVTPSSVSVQDTDRLRAAGFDDVGISSCVQVVAYFNYINRIAEGLGIDVESWIEPNGRVRPE